MISPLANNLSDSWKRLCRGENGIGPITKFDASDYDSRIAGEVKDFDPLQYFPKKDLKKMDLFIQYAVAASEMAVQDAGIKISGEDRYRTGVIIGAGLGGLPTIEKYHEKKLQSGPRKITPFFVPMLIINLAPGNVSIRFGYKGPNYSVVSACASGTHSIGDAFKLIQSGKAEVMLAGGCESVISPMAVGGFSSMKALSTRNDDPAGASRPFDRNRDGFVIAEGAGIMVLEELEYARKRGARIYAEVIGIGMSADAYHISSPDPDAVGAVRSMTACLEDAGISPDEVDYINAHGTSTLINDKQESEAIKKVFGEKASSISISSNKSMIGHLLGAAGGVEGVFTALSLYHGIIPPTINYETPDPECDLDYTPNTSQNREIRTAISNSFGFGGTNATLALRKYQ